MAEGRFSISRSNEQRIRRLITGELPTCAFGFNSHGLAFTLNSVPPAKCEIVAGGVGRNFVSRDLLEAHSIDDALERIYSAKISVQHSYNLIDINSRRILNVETASRNRHSVYEVGEVPFFHANMYLHLNIRQDPDKNSLSRQKRDAALETRSTPNILFIWKVHCITLYAHARSRLI
ncbi:uncharacterized protein LOC127250704 isoform X3 [Andrographis paniculata]|uniref:uncharacterized protein LOC127250704 isoform X3 n=1 Tax=Andrographis paniculata TaxID=175694 RepID=UPI0021E96BD5|nr:uncharacterized protein LOC127250704 isoform X3 [Andrographis paniculata]